MKVAVLVCGMYRELPLSIKSWGFNYDDNFDFYISTWDKSVQKNSNLDINLNDVITEDLIKTYLPNAKVQIFNQNDYDFSSDTFYHNTKQIFHWKNAIKMVKESGIEYEQIMINRSDNFLNYNYTKDFFNNLTKEDRIYGLTPIYISGPRQYFLMDYFFIGSSKNMIKMIETLPNEMIENIHGELAKHFLSLGIVSEQIKDFNLCLVRPNSRNIDNLDFETVQNKFWEWGQNTGK